MTTDTRSAAIEVTRKLNGKWLGSYGLAKCPAHNDAKPSLSIRPGDYTVVYNCFAGCSHDDVKAAVAGEGIALGKLSGKPEGFDRSQIARQRTLQRFAQEIWDRAVPVAGTPAQLYLDRRKIYGNGNCRFDRHSKTVEEVDGEAKTFLRPALVLPIHDNKGFVGIQRIFLTEEGEKADLISPKKILGDAGGGTIRLGAKPQKTLNLAEGYEDAQSTIQLHKLDHCWSVCGKNRYAKIDIPDSVEHIILYGQRGAEAQKGHASAFKHLMTNGRTLNIELPKHHEDWNDMLMDLEAA